MRKTLRQVAAFGLYLAMLAAPGSAGALTNPDQITAYFPAMQGPENLGRNVSTVLSLQLAQTTRRYPWPENPGEDDFGEGIIRWSEGPLERPSHDAAAAAAYRRDLRAQIVVWGSTYHYGDDIVADVNITLPRYKPAPSTGCGASAALPCDYRQENFETWTVTLDGQDVSVDVPRRRFGIAAIVLRPSVVRRYRDATGLPIRERIDGGKVLGHTGSQLRFIEFNRHLDGAPTRLRSGGVEGYVELPELSERSSEYADMVGGILKVFRGDWSDAARSFTRVLNSPQTRVALRVDALLYRGMARQRLGRDGRDDFAAAAGLAPYDRTVARYQVMGELAAGDPGALNRARRILREKKYLFPRDDPWYRTVGNWLRVNRPDAG